MARPRRERRQPTSARCSPIRAASAPAGRSPMSCPMPVRATMNAASPTLHPDRAQTARPAAAPPHGRWRPAASARRQARRGPASGPWRRLEVRRGLATVGPRRAHPGRPRYSLRPTYRPSVGGPRVPTTINSRPSGPWLRTLVRAPVAQRIEQQPSNLSVVGSIPTRGAKIAGLGLLATTRALPSQARLPTCLPKLRATTTRVGAVDGQSGDVTVTAQCKNVTGCPDPPDAAFASLDRLWPRHAGSTRGRSKNSG